MYKDIAIELICGFLALFIMLKLLGKTQFAQITPFDFITTLVLGNIVGDAALEKGVELTEILYSVLIWGLLIYAVTKLSQTFTGFRGVLEGKPSMIIYKGKIHYKELKKNNLDLNQLQHLMRQQGYFSLYEAEYVILETNGEVSVAPKHEFGPPTKNDLNIPYSQTNLPIALIMDGKVVPGNLKEANVDEKWLKKQLAIKKIKEYSEVFYAEWQQERGLEITKF
ncbi:MULTISPECIES: DUF421 domain-containing protein [Priestia]|uniref:DUF421 domain-containing protein n=1 Tax=Priestia aryabhattai TaxID=412384 RepID=A0ABD5KVH7_PRIAR|nr:MULTISPECIES: DUF421 domain-containing protein [Priestia]MBK0293594.1 DUF421 domain-containing protein [Bacillus sp. S34]NHH93153.1 hypothetical protein [Bacillus sp. MB95]UPK52217.1 DUF421 domain-containing protein [Bacillus sp. H8-1]AWD67719.1 DUF421 domain-containing protein [Priestia megaterium]MBY0210594.1 DUF421 domain-containing protein [Priestia aryabhattai]